jgi:uncharacterized protein
VASTHDVEPEQIIIAGNIPALVWRGAGMGPRPVIVHMHGGGGTKWDVRDEVVTHSHSCGVTLLSFDLYMHGDRRPAGRERKRFTPREQVSLLERSVRDLFTVVEYIGDDPAMDEGRIGLRGYSHSATVAHVALGMNVPVHACLSIAGWGDLATGLAHMAHRLDVPSVQIAEELREARQGVMHLNPLHHVDTFPPRPVMMIHGLHDVLAPFSTHFALYEALLPYYRSQPGDCLFLAHADGHWTPAAVEDTGLTWLMQRLGSADP